MCIPVSTSCLFTEWGGSPFKIICMYQVGINGTFGMANVPSTWPWVSQNFRQISMCGGLDFYSQRGLSSKMQNVSSSKRTTLVWPSQAQSLAFTTPTSRTPYFKTLPWNDKIGVSNRSPVINSQSKTVERSSFFLKKNVNKILDMPHPVKWVFQ